MPGRKAAAALLTGEANPSGKLAETWPLGWRIRPVKPVSENREELPVQGEHLHGYRYYDSAEKPFLFPFGHGLSYTRFAYSGLTLSAERLARDGYLTVSLTVRNTGDRPGKETVQLYVGQEEPMIFKPKKELKAFCKLSLEPGGSAG